MLYLTSVALMMSLAAGVAVAEPLDLVGLKSVESSSRTVRYADLNPSTPMDARKLAFRIRVAANDVCGGADALTRTGPDFAVCVARATNAAAVAVNAPIVSAALGLSAAPIILAKQ